MKKLTNHIRIFALILLAGLAAWGLVTLGVKHRSAFPELYAPGSSDYMGVYIALIAAGFLLMPVFSSLGGLLTGYKLYRMRILFFEIAREEKLRVRFSRRIGLGATLLPPQTDGTSPYRLALLSLPLMMGTLGLLCLALAGIFRHAGIARVLLIAPAVCLGVMVIFLLPRRDGSDSISRLLAFRNQDKRRAWECAMHIAVALGEGKKLMDMPEEWFQTYPAEVADDLYVSNCLINGSSRLIRQGRFAEAYKMLTPLFDLKPTPETHQRVACTILNGAICEALEAFPPHCLNQLEHPSVQYMTPPTWQPRVRTAQYARALFVTHDEAAAAALLPQIEKDIEAGHTDGALIRRLQEKAGIGGAQA